jgi:hypothetical protein
MNRGDQTGRANIREAASGLLRGALRQTQAAGLATALIPLAAVPVTLMDGLAAGPGAALAQEGCSGGVCHTVFIPDSARCNVPTDGGEGDSGTALAIAPGGKINLPQYPSLLVTSCLQGTGTSAQRKLFFIDPGDPGAGPVHSLTTTFASTANRPTGAWKSLALRPDRADFLACGDGPTAGSTVIWRIAFSPFHAPPSPGTATFVRTGPPNSTCDGIGWDVIEDRIYQSSTVDVMDGAEGPFPAVLRFDEGAGAATPIPSQCSGDVTGVAVAGSNLFAACPETFSSINRLDKTNGTQKDSVSHPTPDVADIECDPVSFVLPQSWHPGVQHKDVVWYKDKFFGEVYAIEVPFGTCGPVEPPPFSGLFPGFPSVCDADGDGTPDDSDGDGLFDCWENGIYWADTLPGVALDGIYSVGRDPAGVRFTLAVDANGIPGIQQGEYATPDKRDAFLEIDFMTGHRPMPEAVADVVLAFANAPAFGANSGKCTPPNCTAGVRLHVLVNEEIPHRDRIALVPCTGAAGANDVDFDKIKAGTAFSTPAGGFGVDATERGNPALMAARTMVFRYGVFAHNQVPVAPATSTTSSGCGEVLGNDWIVTRGSWTVPSPQRPGHTGGVGSRIEQGGTLIHEFGHNLNLRHAGFGNTPNCLVNYPSSMNYSLQTLAGRMPDYSRHPRCTGGPGVPAGCLPDVNECSVSEAAGIGPYTGKVVYGPRTGFPAKPKTVDYIANTPLNYDQDASSAETYPRDLNNATAAGGSCAPSAPVSPNTCDVHQASDDWANIQLNFRATTDFLDGVAGDEGPCAAAPPGAPCAVHFSIDPDKGTGTLDLTYEESRQMSADAIDIKPGDSKNTINRQSSQSIHVAMLSRPASIDGTDPGFDATDIDPATVLFRGVGEGTWAVRPKECGFQDVNGDGLVDLVCRFDMLKGTPKIGEMQAAIEAMTFGPDPQPFSGIDSIRVQN